MMFSITYRDFHIIFVFIRKTYILSNSLEKMTFYIYTRGKQKLESVFRAYCHFRSLFFKKQYYVLKAHEIRYKTVYLYFSCH